MSQVVVQLERLGKHIEGRDVLQDVSATVNAGDVIGVIGKNGAGKTTLLETLLGLSPASTGNSRIFDADCLRMPATVKERIGFVPQQDELIGLLTGQRQLELVSTFYKQWDRALLARLAREWELPLDRHCSSLSGGEKQKVSTLMALGNRPDLLVLDEPVSSLDPLARRQFLQQLLEIASDESRAVIFSTHIVSDLERVANRIWIMRDGRLLWDGETDALKESVQRLHIRASRTLPSDLVIPGLLNQRRGADGLSATLTVRDVPGEQITRMAAQLDATIEPEALGLEDIFLELHS